MSLKNRFFFLTYLDMSRFTAFSEIANGDIQGAQTFDNSINPTTKEKLWDVPVATRRDIDDAVEVANAVHQAWSREPINERGRLL